MPDGQPPIAKRVACGRNYHDDTVVDEYAWLHDRHDPDTLAYLRAEDAYADEATASLAALRRTILEEFRLRARATSLTLPTRKGVYWYYNRTEAGCQHIIHCRVPAQPGSTEPPRPDTAGLFADEEILLDRNALANGSAYFTLGIFDISPNGQLLLYGTDDTGAEQFTLHVKDLDTGRLLPDEFPDVRYGSAWSADSTTLFFVTADHTGRPCRVWRHQLGQPENQLVHEEPDERFRISVMLTRSGGFVLITARSRTASEVLFVPAAVPDTPPRVIAARRGGVDYTVDHQGDRFVILHNADAPDFALAWATPSDPGEWHPLVPSSPGTRLLQVHAFAEHVVLPQRHDGTTGLRIVPRTGAPRLVTFPGLVHTVLPDRNLEYHTTTVRLRYSSFVTPESIYDCALDTGALTIRKRKRKEVLSGFQPDRYEQHTQWAVAPDGTKVPVSIAAHRDTPRDGTAALVLYGYGAYGTSVDPWFSATRLSLLDRGVVYAVAHPRGGGELGSRWHDDGKELAKKNTFTDFIAVVDHLVSSGWAAPGRVVARGASAGGLLVGVVANMAPDRFAGIVAQAPFVDPLTTMLDPTSPLTVGEWEEWGNPREDAAAYAYLKSYSPYENVNSHAYPPILATTNLNDTRVLYHEPAKWVARLRARSPATRVLLHVNLDGGHEGPSGKDHAWAEEAFMTAWILDRLGVGTA